MEIDFSYFDPYYALWIECTDEGWLRKVQWKEELERLAPWFGNAKAQWSVMDLPHSQLEVEFYVADNPRGIKYVYMILNVPDGEAEIAEAHVKTDLHINQILEVDNDGDITGEWRFSMPLYIADYPFREEGGENTDEDGEID